MKKKTTKKIVKKAAPRKAAPAPKKKAVTRPAPAARPSSSVGITPLGEKVLVRMLTEEEMGTTSPSGIIIPDTAAKEKNDRGIVVAVGPGRVGDDHKLVPIGVSIGEKVLFQWGDKVEFGGKEYFLVSENNILAIIK